MSGPKDVSAIIKGLQILLNEAAKQTKQNAARKWNTSSLFYSSTNVSANVESTPPQTDQPSSVKYPSALAPSEVVARLGMVASGITSYVSTMQKPISESKSSQESSRPDPSGPEETRSTTTEVLDNFDLSSNQKLQSDLDVGANLSSNARLDMAGRLAAEAVEDAKANLDSSLNQTKSTLSSLQEEVGNIPGQVTDEQMEAIDKKLEDLHGAAYVSELSSLNDGVQKSTSNMANVIKESVKEEQSSSFGRPYSPNIMTGNSSTHYDPIMDPKIEELDLEKILAKREKAFQQATEETTSTEVPVAKKPTKSATVTPKLLGRKPLAKNRPESLLSSSSRARKVPDNRLSRLVSFGTLATGLGIGTVAEVGRRALGISGNNKGTAEGTTKALLDDSPVLTEANVNRIADTLCKVRGAALKIGQMMSIQDSTLINPQLQQILERVRQSADFMPEWQLEKIMTEEFGESWRDNFASFCNKPFAAASIGQVHEAQLPDGRLVAVKIQYPGVAAGIDSDINNLMTTLSFANLFPEGFFVENIMEVAKRELAWECDYEREAQCGIRFAELVKPYPSLYVPALVPQVSSSRVLTTELIEGVAVDKCTGMDQDTRNFIAFTMLELTLRELFQFGYMQTDPNWANFFYNESTRQITLLDFGACREFKKSFVDLYIEIIHGAATGDREKVRKYSQEIGFLTGYEAKVMVDAHVDAVMILGEAFSKDKPFSFGKQNTTRRIQTLVPTMVEHRMCPPPEEIYSLHRKMSGLFLLCGRLDAIINVTPVFLELYDNYKYGGEWNH